VKDIPEIVTALAVSLVTVNVCAEEDEPTPTLPKLKLEGEMVTVG
jgi:hypothetical protein